MGEITSLSKDIINKINKITKNIKIKSMKDYPDNGKHLYIEWEIPVKITRNEDTIWLTPDEPSKDDYWLVYPGNTVHFGAKQFENLDEAVLYGLGEYIEWLNMRKATVDNILDDLMKGLDRG